MPRKQLVFGIVCVILIWIFALWLNVLYFQWIKE